jgi:hypothetical protein
MTIDRLVDSLMLLFVVQPAVTPSSAGSLGGSSGGALPSRTRREIELLQQLVNASVLAMQ